MMVAMAIDQGDQLQGLLPVIARGFYVWPDVGKKLNADLHDHPSALKIRRIVLTARRAPLNRGTVPSNANPR
jgi:hypothetical protein